MRVLITGGEGFIGRASRRELELRGHDVVTLDSMHPRVHGHRPRPPADDSSVRGDIRDRPLLRHLLRDRDAVLHLAAEGGLAPSMAEPARFSDANVTGMAVLLEELRASAAGKLVVASSMAVYGEGAYRCARDGGVRARPRTAEDARRLRWEVPCTVCGRPLRPVPTPESLPPAPTSVYSVTKCAQEQLAVAWGLAYGLPTVALRYFCTYGPGQSMSNPYTGLIVIFLSALMAGRQPVVFEDGLQTRDFVFVDDVARANADAVEAVVGPGAPEVLNVGTGRRTTVLEVARMLHQLTGKGGHPHVLHRLRAGDVRHIGADTARIEAVLGWRPRVSLPEGLKVVVDWAETQRSRDQSAAALAQLERFGLIR